MSNSDWIIVPNKYIDKVDIYNQKSIPNDYILSTKEVNNKKLPFLEEIKIVVNSDSKKNINKNISPCYPTIEKKNDKRIRQYYKFLYMVSFTGIFISVYLYKYYTTNIDTIHL